MKKLTTVIMVLSLVLGGVAMAAAADVPQTPQGVSLSKVVPGMDLSMVKKISDKEAQGIKGTYMASVGGQFFYGNINCPSYSPNPVGDANKYRFGVR